MRPTFVCTALLFAFSQNPGQAGPAKWGPTPEEELERQGIAIDSRSLASLAIISSLDADTRRLTILALARKGDPAHVGLLTSLLTDSDASIRGAVVQGLGHLRATSAVPDLQTAAKADPDVEVRQLAVGAIGTIGGASAADALLAIASDVACDQQLRIDALGFLAGGAPVFSLQDHERLVEILRDGDRSVRTLAAVALSRTRNPAAVPVLVESALHPATEEWMRDHAIRSLEDMIESLDTGYIGQFGQAARGDARSEALTNLAQWWKENRAIYVNDANEAEARD